MEGSSRHAAVLGELVEWWEDLPRTRSRCVLLAVPPRWGRSTVLERLAAVADAGDAVSLQVAVDGASLPPGAGAQAGMLRDLVAAAGRRRRVAELLGADRLPGVVQLGLGAAGLLASPPVAAGVLAAGIGVGAAGRVWDDSAAGQQGALARAARAAAALSVQVPVLVTVDDADLLDQALAVRLVEGLLERPGGQVLVVAAAGPGGALARALLARARFGLTEGRVRQAEADPGMGFTDRAALAAELCPQLPGEAARRIAQRARDFAGVFALAAAPRLAELGGAGEGAVAVVDEVADALPVTVPPSQEAVVLAWAGGVLHARQAAAALAAAGAESPGGDGAVVRAGWLVRLPGPVPAALDRQVRTMAPSARRQLAAAVLAAAAGVGADPQAGLVEQVVAAQAAHRVRIDLPGPDRGPLRGVQFLLVRGLEALGDLAAAYQAADDALAGYDPGEQDPQRGELTAAVLRLARAGIAPAGDPVTAEAIRFALAGGPAVGLEARVWAAADLLGQPHRRAAALDLADQVATDLDTRPDMGELGVQWRLLLALRAGQAGYPALTQRLLAPLLDPATPRTWDAAQAVLAAVSGPQADTRLQIVVLEAELLTTPAGMSEDRLRLHHALAAGYGQLGDYRQALTHAQSELPLRLFHQGPDHSDTLATRANIARWTGEAGDPATAHGRARPGTRPLPGDCPKS